MNQKMEVINDRGLTTKNIIAEAIRENYDINKTTNIRELGKWIVEFTDTLMNMYPDAFITDPYTVKEHSMINDRNIFYGYIALSAVLRGDPLWKERLVSKMNSIDFSNDNPVWKQMGLIRKRNANRALKDKLYQLFTEGV